MTRASVNEMLSYAVNTVNSYLKLYFKQLRLEVEQEHHYATDLLDIVEDYTLRGGKRLRAALALIGYWSRAWKSGSEQEIAKVMAAIELLQSYLLTHDDIMDKDELRRGGPTVHVWFRNKCVERSWSDCEHYGISQAITAGDYLEALAISLLASVNISRENLSELIKTYSRGLRKVAYGQFLDVLFSKAPLRSVKEKDVLVVYNLKTASYTVELPLLMGAITSEAYTKEMLDTFSKYAANAGIAFQIRDDIIGLYGDPQVTGKPAGSDVKGKKKTLLVVKAYELAAEKDRRFLELVYDKLREDEITMEHVEEVRRLVRETGSLDYSLEVIKRHVENALAILESTSSICDEAREVLKELTLKLAYREK